MGNLTPLPSDRPDCPKCVSLRMSTEYRVRVVLDLLHDGKVDEAVTKLLPAIGWDGNLDAWKAHQREIRT